ncbi:hypothetical protein [Spirosoma endbachense]|uniref:Secretion system C-terminal sorting domain-containing protein n=1 Tax=Spirosoma endbachense TaxID=2666025 RepID=A0A6P1VVB7_9BACT|nr:hypothetical protein [Spirosoma endbachense]QHV95316.1 hypothetical protein GJR95_09955 [Spirosoma endbachense]
MKTVKHLFAQILSLSLIVLSIAGKAQSTDQELTSWAKEKSFEIGTYMGENRTVNLMLMVRQTNGVTIRIKNADDEILHELSMKKSPRAYHYKLNFDGSRSGLYKLEITDGRKTLIRRIEVVDVPATEAQRYITFTSPSSL